MKIGGEEKAPSLKMTDFPKIIHQSWANESLREDYKKYSQTWKDLHPDYEYILWTDEDNLNLIKEEDPSFLNDYNSYNHYIKRADAARYYYMYKHRNERRCPVEVAIKTKPQEKLSNYLNLP